MFVNLSVSGNFLVVPEWRVRLCSIVVNATGLKPGDRRFDSAQGLTEIFCLSACIYPSSQRLQYIAFLCLMEMLARSHGGWFTSSNWRLIVQFHLRRKQFSVCPPWFSMAVSIDSRSLVFEHLVATLNKLNRREVTATVCPKVGWRIFSAYPLKWTVTFLRNGRLLTTWRILMCTYVS